jgi:hypothetical protein
MRGAQPVFGVNGQFGNQSKVTPEETRAQIEALLDRYGADGFQYAADRRAHRAAIAFRAHGRVVRLTVQMPDPEDPAFTITPGGKQRVRRRNTPNDPVMKAYEKVVRQRWRALLLIVRAKLEAILCGVTTFEDEFLANIVIAGGRTLGEHVVPQLEAACEGDRGGEALLRLPAAGPRDAGRRSRA